jgi:hypothetical protein
MSGRAKEAQKHAKKMAQKRAAKAAKRALYASMAGSSRKHKKILSRSKLVTRFNPNKHKHLIDDCGNPGCKKCYPQYA